VRPCAAYVHNDLWLPCRSLIAALVHAALRYVIRPTPTGTLSRSLNSWTPMKSIRRQSRLSSGEFFVSTQIIRFGGQ